jgi:hypothetical protein
MEFNAQFLKETGTGAPDRAKTIQSCEHHQNPSVKSADARPSGSDLGEHGWYN